jgi:hypothetical protein
MTKRHFKKDERSAPTPKEVELVVTQEDFDAGLKRGWTDDDMLKPGRYKLKRGGILARHPELKLNCAISGLDEA